MIAGGRYDGLIEQLGGPHTPAVGWAAGIERLAMMIDAPDAEMIDAVIVPIEERGEAVARWLCSARLRAAGIAVDMAYRGNMKADAARRRQRRAIRFDRRRQRSGSRRSAQLKAWLTASSARVASPMPTSGRGAAGMKSISLDRIVSIEAKKHDLAEAMAAPDLAPDDFVRLSQGICADRAGRRRGARGPPAARRAARC